MTTQNVGASNQAALLEQARQRAEAERRRLAEQAAAEAAKKAGSADAAERAAQTAQEAPIAKDNFVANTQAGQSTAEQRTAIYDRVNTDGEEGLSDSEFDNAFALSTLEGAVIDPEKPQPTGTADSMERQITQAKDRDRQTIEEAMGAYESLPEDMRGQYQAQTQQLQQAYEAKWGEPAAGPAGATAQTYDVQSGDSLSKIAQEMTGDAGRWNELYEANKDTIGADPNLIQPGQQLKVPESWQPEPPAETPPVEETPPAEQPPADPVLTAANAAVDAAESKVGEPKHTDAMYAGAGAAQAENENTLITNAQSAIDALPEGAERTAAQTRLDGVKTAYETKHGTAPTGAGGAAPGTVEPRGARREDTAEDLAKADASEPGSDSWKDAMRDAIKGVDEGDLNEDNRNDLHAIADRYQNYAAESGKETYAQRAEALRLIADNPDFNGDAAEKIIHSMQDTDDTDDDLAKVRDEVLDTDNPSPAEMRAFALANAAANSDDPLEMDYSAAVLTASEASSPDVRKHLAYAMKDKENTTNNLNDALAAAQTPEDFAAIAAIAGYKETHREGEVDGETLDAIRNATTGAQPTS
jgi:nucleoid-associated protein YgaU